jgi:hypothetical protein
MKSGPIITASFIFVIVILSPLSLAEGLEPEPESPHIHIHINAPIASESDQNLAPPPGNISAK